MTDESQRWLAGFALGGGLLYLLTREEPPGEAEAGSMPGGSRPSSAPRPPRPAAPSSPPRPPRKPAARVNRSNVDGAGHVRQSPAKLLAQAREFDPRVNLDELAAARLIVSEFGRGSAAEWAAIVDVERNRAEANGRSLADSLMGPSGRFGRQGSAKRPASTAQDPSQAQLAAAIEMVRFGKGRGISRGARRFFDPRVQDAQHRKWKAGKTSRVHSCSALELLEAWSFDYRRGVDADGKRRRRCPPDRSRVGKNTLAWAGPIEGVDAYELMLMAPMSVGEEHTRRYQAARSLIEVRRLALLLE